MNPLLNHIHYFGIARKDFTFFDLWLPITLLISLSLSYKRRPLSIVLIRRKYIMFDIVLTINHFSPDRYIGFYIGVNDKSSENNFVNYEGTVQTWTNWDAGEPNDDDSPPQDCVIMKPMFAYRWKDTECDGLVAGLCFIRCKNIQCTKIIISYGYKETII